MGGRLFLGNQMISPVIIQGEENPILTLENGILTKNYGDENGTSFPGIVELGPYSMKDCYNRYSSIYGTDVLPSVGRKVSFPDLKKIGKLSLESCFTYQYDIKELEVPLLEEVDDFGLYSISYSLRDFYCCFDSLYKIGEYGFELFGYSFENSVFIFPALKTEFLVYEDMQFYNMLRYGNNNFVYFPSSVDNTMGNWDYIVSGMGGTNTTVIFWIPTQIKMNFEQGGTTVLSNYKYIADRLLVTDASPNFVVYNSSLNKVYLANQTGCTENERREYDFDFDDYTYNKITLTINESDSSKISASWNNIAIPLTQESSTVYSVYLNSSIGEQINISVSASETHASTSAIVTTSGQDIEETIVLPEYEDFVRPNLSSNGTPGGEFFAVKSMYDESDTEVYKAFDGNNSTYWGITGNYMYLGFYNPQPIMVSRIVLKCTDSSYVPARVVAMFDGNDDFWGNQISVTYSTNGNEMTIVPQTTEFYKYQIILGVINSEARIAEVEIYGKVPE